MADLKLGTTLGGAGLWSASNLPLLPTGGQLTYKGFRVYTENDRPTAEDIDALSLINGGTVAKNTTFSQNVTVGVLLTAANIQANSGVSIVRSAAPPSLVFRRPDLTAPTGAETGILDAAAYNGSGVIVGAININQRADVGNKMYLRVHKDGTQTAMLSIDSQTAQTTVEVGTFRVVNATVLAGVSATTLNVTGALTANTVTPSNWQNHDVRYMTGIPTAMAGTSFGAAAVTEKNDVLSVGGNITDGPYGNATYVGQLVNYRRTLNTGTSLVQFYLDNGVFHTRSGSGSPGAWSWNGGDANGWRKVYDTNNPPTAAETGAVKLTGDTMSGPLTITTNAPSLFLRGNTTDTRQYVMGFKGAGGSSWYVGKANVNSEFCMLWNYDGSNGVELNPNGVVRLAAPGGVVIENIINQDAVPAGSYLSSGLASTAQGGKSLLRRFRGGSGDVIWHETVQSGAYRIATGNTDVEEIVLITSSGTLSLSGPDASETSLRVLSNSNSVLYFQTATGAEKVAMYANTDGILNIRTQNTAAAAWTMYRGMIWAKTVTSGSEYALIRGTPDGGSYDAWRERSSGVQIDMPNGSTSAYSVWKATVWGQTHVAAMDVHIPSMVAANARVRIIHQSGAYFYFQGSGEFNASGNGNFADVYIRSDEKLKSNFKKIESALDKVDQLDGMIYDKADHIGGEPIATEAGIIAQQLQAVLPEAVRVSEDTKGNEILVVSPTATIALLVNAIKELREEVRELKAR